MLNKIIEAPSPNFNERPAGIDAIIIHYTDMDSAEAALAWLTNPISQVSAHYLIDEDGQIYRMVAEEHRAWHAGESYWQGFTNLNDCSIGIELANPGHSHQYTPFPECQIDSLIALCLDLKRRWDIPSNRILGHSDVAPMRKQDPGHLFPWERLAREGLGMWASLLHSQLPFDFSTSCLRSGRTENITMNVEEPFALSVATKQQSRRMNSRGGTVCPERSCEAAELKGENYMDTLSTVGYDVTSPIHALIAFQRHFQPHKVDGVADQETYTLLNGLLKAQKELI